MIKQIFFGNDVKELIKMYEYGFSEDAIARLFGCSRKAISNKLNENCVLRRSPNRDYKINENVFDGELNEEKEYWLGIMITDGNVEKRGNRINYGCSIKDEEHLYKFKGFLSSNSPIYHTHQKDGRIFCSVGVSSKKIKTDIAKYGIVPRKTPIAHAVDSLKDSRHFWRGCIDGDGHVCFYKNRNCSTYTQEMNITGSPCLTQQFSDFIFRKLGFVGRVEKHGDNGYKRTVFYCEKAFQVLKYLYDNNTISMDRKYNEYLKMVEYRKLRGLPDLKTS